jgi:ubiquinone/menaquinone biosynthesis C-methylase UbiE
MSGAIKMCGRDTSEERNSSRHRGKFTEDLLDSERILEALNIQAGQIIVDAGCGNGYMSKLFSKRVDPSGRVYALDPDTHSIKVLRDETQGMNIETIEGDITKTTLVKESSVDLIYISAVIHAFSKNQMQGFLQEVKRLLKPGAKLAIVEIEKKKTPFGPPLELRYSPEELRETVPLVPVNTVQAGEHFYMQIFRK